MRPDRYVDDVPYERGHIRYQAPAWLDFTGLLWGVAPRRREAGFAWCDLGCGQGVTAVLLAATQPHGQFLGIDAMPGHIAHARALARDAGAANAVFHAADFGAALELDLPQFDYITAHGVYSWVDDRARADLLAFVEARLKPGGKVYLSYNALPGRAADLPFQQLLFWLSEAAGGDSVARVRTAVGLARRMRDVNAAAVTGSPMAQSVLAMGGRHGVNYLAHEFLNPHWRPLGVAEVRRDLAAIGLSPAGSATLADNFDSYVLTRRAQRILAGVDDPARRETVRDYLVNASFRRDVFVRDPEMLDADAQASALADTVFSLTRPPQRVRYRFDTTAGEIAFDTPRARAIVRALTGGARRLRDLPGGLDGLPSVLALAASGGICPAEPPGPGAARFNAAVKARAGGPEALGVLALDCGVGVTPPRRILDAILHATAPAGGWRDYVNRYGARLGAGSASG